MWLTSNTPTFPRTLLCSATSPPVDGYSTGISQPPKSTIFAPIARCMAFSGVLRSGAVAESTKNSSVLQLEFRFNERAVPLEPPQIAQLQTRDPQAYVPPRSARGCEPCLLAPQDRKNRRHRFPSSAAVQPSSSLARRRPASRERSDVPLVVCRTPPSSSPRERIAYSKRAGPEGFSSASRGRAPSSMLRRLLARRCSKTDMAATAGAAGPQFPCAH